jgi:hypothetical protein
MKPIDRRVSTFRTMSRVPPEGGRVGSSSARTVSGLSASSHPPDANTAYALAMLRTVPIPFPAGHSTLRYSGRLMSAGCAAWDCPSCALPATSATGRQAPYPPASHSCAEPSAGV